MKVVDRLFSKLGIKSIYIDLLTWYSQSMGNNFAKDEMTK